MRRIPGLNYDSRSHSLTYNGKPLNEIYVNGEVFFAGNKQVALENLPAELIARLKVYNKKTDREDFTGITGGEENYVLDLQTKKKLNGTLMASVTTGMGNHHKYNHELTANYFRQGGENLSLTGSLGNTKITSDYDRNRAMLGALNFTRKPTSHLTLNGNVYAGNERRGERNATYQEQYLLSESQSIYRTGFQNQQNQNVNAMLKLLYRMDSKMMMTWEGTFLHNGNNNLSDSRQAAYHTPISLPEGTNPLWPWDFLGTQPSSLYEQTGLIRSNTANGSYATHIGINYRLNEKGSTLGIEGRYRYGNSKANQFAHNSIVYHRLKKNEGLDSVLRRNLYRDAPQTNRQYELTAVWTQPLAKHLRMQLSATLQSAHTASRRSVYDLTPWELPSDGTLPEHWETALTDSLSDRHDSQTDKFIHKIRMNYHRAGWNVLAEITAASQRQTLHRQRGTTTADTTLRNMQWNASMQINGKWGANAIRATYNSYSQHPNPALLLSLPDLSNPMNIHLGNKDLKPSYTHSLRIQWDNPKAGFYAQSEWQQEFNGITYASVYDPKSGGRTSFPINVSGNKLLNGTMRYTKLLHKVILTLQGDGRWHRQVGMIGEVMGKPLSTSITDTYGINAKLALSYQRDWGGMMLSADRQWDKHTNSIHHTSIRQQDYTLEGNAFAELPLDLQTETHLYYVRQTGNRLDGMEQSLPVWDMSVSWRFLRKKQARITLAWTDILQGKRNYSRQASSTGYHENHSQQVGSYFLLSFTYRLNIQQ
ncbi:MAG: outer membrane beta-barrel protein [Bacteroidales bacterium]|nr:outer membrane beta-barrel protein [Bacteroidales bacterium]